MENIGPVAANLGGQSRAAIEIEMLRAQQRATMEAQQRAQQQAQQQVQQQQLQQQLQRNNTDVQMSSVDLDMNRLTPRASTDSSVDLSVNNRAVNERVSTDMEDSDQDNDAHNQSQEEIQGGDQEDGKSGKLTLSILLAENLIEPGDGVLSIDYLGQSFKGDLLPIGQIRSVGSGMIFSNPSAWAIHCKKSVNPNKRSGCGWGSIKYKGKKMDFYKSLWLKRRAQREAENAKNEAAHALTALSAAFTSSPKLASKAPPPSGSVSPGVAGGMVTPNSPATAVAANPLALLATTLPMIVSPVPIQQVTGSGTTPSVSGMPDLELLHQTPLLTVPAPNMNNANPLAAMTSSLQAMNAASSMVALSASSLAVAAAEAQGKTVLKHNQMLRGLQEPKEHYVELESFMMEGKMQPFTVSVSTSAILVLDLHSHLAKKDVCGYLAGYWDTNSHNLAITASFPVLLEPNMAGTEEAQRVESDIYTKLYSNHLSLIGWYHSSPKGPSIPTVKDCFDQLDFQIKLLGNGNDTYTPCIGMICSPYEASGSKSLDSSIVLYWMYPPSESNASDYGKPMRMSYSAIADPCLSSECMEQIDKVMAFYKDKDTMVDLKSQYNTDLRFVDKIGKSLASKFPQDQDNQLWLYIKSQLIGKDDRPDSQPDLNNSQVSHPQTMAKSSSGASRLPSGLTNGVAAGSRHLQSNNHSQSTNHMNLEEEEIDDDEESALKDNDEEIDDDEDKAIANFHSRNGFPTGMRNYSPLSFNQIISTSPPRLGHNGELDLTTSGKSNAQTITMYSLHGNEGDSRRANHRPNHDDDDAAPLNLTRGASATSSPSPADSLHLLAQTSASLLASHRISPKASKAAAGASPGAASQNNSYVGRQHTTTSSNLLTSTSTLTDAAKLQLLAASTASLLTIPAGLRNLSPLPLTSQSGPILTPRTTPRASPLPSPSASLSIHPTTTIGPRSLQSPVVASLSLTSPNSGSRILASPMTAGILSIPSPSTTTTVRTSPLRLSPRGSVSNSMPSSPSGGTVQITTQGPTTTLVGPDGARSLLLSPRQPLPVNLSPTVQQPVSRQTLPLNLSPVPRHSLPVNLSVTPVTSVSRTLYQPSSSQPDNNPGTNTFEFLLKFLEVKVNILLLYNIYLLIIMYHRNCMLAN